jgi:hypothetical protein
MSLRNLVRLSSTLTVLGMSRFASGLSMLVMLQLGSSMSLSG